MHLCFSLTGSPRLSVCLPFYLLLVLGSLAKTLEWCREHGNMPREGERKGGKTREKEKDKVRARVWLREAGREGGLMGSSPVCTEQPPPSMLAGNAARRLVAPPLLPPPTVPSSSSPAMREERRRRLAMACCYFSEPFSLCVLLCERHTRTHTSSQAWHRARVLSAFKVATHFT